VTSARGDGWDATPSRDPLGTGAGCTVIFSYCFSSPPFSKPARDPGAPRPQKFPHTPSVPICMPARTRTRDAPNFLRLFPQEGAPSGTLRDLADFAFFMHRKRFSTVAAAFSGRASANRANRVISDTDRKDTSIGREVKIRQIASN